MVISESVKSLSSEDGLVRRASARNLSDMAESDPMKFKEDDLGGIIKVLREEDDALTLDCLLKVVDFVAPLNLPYLVNNGLLRVLMEIYLKNMGGIGVNVGRNAMRLISVLASADTEGAEKLDVVGLILRAITSSADPYIRWYGSAGLRKLDPSLIQKSAPEIVGYSVDALSKENEDRIRVVGALTLSLIASVAPKSLAEKDGIRTLVRTLLKDPSQEVQALAALAVQFVVRKDPTQLRGARVGEALCITLINKLDELKKNENRVDREILVIVASAISILAMKDLSTLTESKGIEEINITEVITNALDESKEEDDLRPILLSILLELSDKAQEYINNKKTVKVLTELLEKGEQRDIVHRSLLSILNRAAANFPTLFSDAKVLEKIAALSLKREKKGAEKMGQHGPSPTDVLDTLLSSEKGYRAVLAGFQKLYGETPYLVTELCEARNWKNLISQIKGEPVAETKIEKSVSPTATPVQERATAPTEETGKRIGPPSSRLNDEQKALLQEIFNTHSEIPLPDLAAKLNVQEAIIKEALNKLIQSGKIPYRIEDNILYLKKGLPAAVKAKGKEKITLCIWCGDQLRPGEEKCPSCGKAPPTCLICNVALTTDDEIEKCPFCGTLFHGQHYKKWAEEKKRCPKCRVAWAST